MANGQNMDNYTIVRHVLALIFAGNETTTGKF